MQHQKCHDTLLMLAIEFWHKTSRGETRRAEEQETGA
jgi:hypothetical protein